MHGLGVDQVVVIEHQQRLVRIGPGGQFVDQRGHQPLVRRRRGRAEQRPHPLGEPRPHPVQRGHAMAPEPRRVVIAGVQRQPRHRLLAAPRPVGQQDRLAVPRRGADQHQPARQALVEAFAPAAGAAPGQGAAWAHAAWWPARHLARRPPPMGAAKGGSTMSPPCPRIPAEQPRARRAVNRGGTIVPSPSRQRFHPHGHLRVTPIRSRVRSVQIHGPKPKDGTWA